MTRLKENYVTPEGALDELYGYDLLTPLGLEPPFTDFEIESLRFINTMLVSDFWMDGICRKGQHRYERQLAKVIRRVVWLRDKGTTDRLHINPIPRFTLHQFDYYLILRGFFPDRVPMDSQIIFGCIAGDISDGAAIYHFMEQKLFRDMLENWDEYFPEQEEKPDRAITYFIKCKTTNRIKIGKTVKHPMERLKALSCGSASDLELLGVIHKNMESLYHEEFKEHRIKGEWFDAHPDILEFIERNVIPYDPTLLEQEETILIQNKG